RLGSPQQVEVDLDVEDLLHATDVGVAELLVRVEEGAVPLDTGGGIDDLVAVDPAAPALDLVLRMQRQLARPGDGVALGLHVGILGELGHPPQDLTSTPERARAPSGPRTPYRYAAAANRSTTLSTSICVNARKSGSPPSGCSSARNQSACTVVIPSSPAPRTSSYSRSPTKIASPGETRSASSARSKISGCGFRFPSPDEKTAKSSRSARPLRSRSP